MGNNPIWHNDVLGDTLDIANNEASKNDINSLVKSNNQKYVTFKNNRVNIDFSNLSTQEKSDLLKSDEGLKLINDLVTSGKKILYEALDYALLRNATGKKMTLMFTLPANIINASTRGKDAANGHRDLPKEGYQGQVVIHPKVEFEENDQTGTSVKKTRASIVFHELAENYERTHNNIDYKGTKGAHNRAKSREARWHGKSEDPGNVSKVIKAPSPTRSRFNIISNITKEYMSWEE